MLKRKETAFPMTPAVSIASVGLALCALWSHTTYAAGDEAQDIEIGRRIDEIVASAPKNGIKVTPSREADVFFAYLLKSNELVGIYRVCNGRVYEHSASVSGGAVGLVKRVAQFNNQYGVAAAQAESRMLDSAEFNMIEFTWRQGDQTFRVTFYPQSLGALESQWVSYASLRYCNP